MVFNIICDSFNILFSWASWLSYHCECPSKFTWLGVSRLLNPIYPVFQTPVKVKLRVQCNCSYCNCNVGMIGCGGNWLWYRVNNALSELGRAPPSLVTVTIYWNFSTLPICQWWYVSDKVNCFCKCSLVAWICKNIPFAYIIMIWK